MPGIYDISRRKSLAGDEVPLSRFEGQVLLIVNTASACGFTPQYKGLEALHRENSQARGFAVLGFPATVSGAQEPGDARAIEGVLRDQVSRDVFPMFAKIERQRQQGRIRCMSISETRNRGPAGVIDQMEFHQIRWWVARARWFSAPTRRPSLPKD